MNSIISSAVSNTATSAVSASSKSLAKVAGGLGIVGLIAAAGFVMYKAVKSSKASNKAEETAPATADATTSTAAKGDEVLDDLEKANQEMADLNEEMRANNEHLGQLVEQTKEMVDEVNAMKADASTTMSDEEADAKVKEFCKELDEILESKGYYIGKDPQLVQSEMIDDCINIVAEMNANLGNEFSMANPETRVAVYSQVVFTARMLPDMTSINSAFEAKRAEINAELDAMDKQLDSISEEETVDHLHLAKGEKHLSYAEREAIRIANEEPWTVIGSEKNLAAVEFIRSQITSEDTAVTCTETDEDGNMFKSKKLVEMHTRNISHMLFMSIREGSIHENTVDSILREMNLMARATIVKNASVTAMVLRMIDNVPEWVLDTSVLSSRIESYEFSNEENILDDACDRNGFKAASVGPRLDFGHAVDDLVEMATRRSK